MRPIHIPLDEHGLEAQWIDIRDPRSLTKRTVERWRRSIEEGSLDPEDFAREIILAWHLLDGDTGVELNDPSKDDIGGVPLVVFQVMNERIGASFRGPLAVQGSAGPNRGVADGDTRSATAPS